MRKCDLMGTGQIEPEGFGPSHKLTQMRITPKQVLHELSPQGLLSADHLAARFGVAFREG